MLKIRCWKGGMTRVFRSDGQSVPVTMLYAFTSFSSRSLGQFGTKCSRFTRPQLCNLIKLNSNVKELDFDETSNQIKILTPGQKVNIRGTSIGKGFSGVIKRYGFKSGRASHGNSKAHNQVGSTGMTQDPGRVFKGKKMPGRMGGVAVTVKNLEVVFASGDGAFILIKGSVPGHNNGCLAVSDRK